MSQKAEQGRPKADRAKRLKFFFEIFKMQNETFLSDFQPVLYVPCLGC